MDILQQPIGILGGSFDPVHAAHLRMALDVCHTFNLAHIKFIPCKQPTYKDKYFKASSQVSNADRVMMLTLALAPYPTLQLDQRELQRNTPSYTVDTLYSLRQELPQTPLCFILGSDTFATIASWHRWQELLTLSHLIVVVRPGANLPTTGPAAMLLQQHGTQHPDHLRQHLAGQLLIHQGTPMAISSSQIRNLIKNGQGVPCLLPEPVLHYIEEHFLYR